MSALASADDVAAKFGKIGADGTFDFTINFTTNPYEPGGIPETGGAYGPSSCVASGVCMGWVGEENIFTRIRLTSGSDPLGLDLAMPQFHSWAPRWRSLASFQKRTDPKIKNPTDVQKRMGIIDNKVRREFRVDLPDGVYNLFVAMGDAAYSNHLNHLEVATGGGKPTRLTDPDGMDHFDLHVSRVLVVGGSLILRPAGDSKNAVASFLRITDMKTNPMPSDLPPQQVVTKQAGLDIALEGASWEHGPGAPAGGVRLKWSEPSSTAPGIRYLVFRRDAPGKHDYKAPFAVVDKPAGFDALLQGVPNGKSSCFVLVKDLDGTLLPASGESCVSPPPFQGIAALTIEPSGSLTASWIAPSADFGASGYHVFLKKSDGTYDFSTPDATADASATSLSGLPVASAKGQKCAIVRAKSEKFADTNLVESCVEYDPAAYQPLDLTLSGLPSGQSSAPVVTLTANSSTVETVSFALIAGAPSSQDPEVACAGASFGAHVPIGQATPVAVATKGVKTLCVRGHDAGTNQWVTRVATWTQLQSSPPIEPTIDPLSCQASNGAVVPPEGFESKQAFQAELVEPGSSCVAGTRKRQCVAGVWTAWNSAFPADKCEVLSYPYATHPDPVLRRVVPLVAPQADGNVQVLAYGIAMANGLFISTNTLSSVIPADQLPKNLSTAGQGYVLRKADGTPVIVQNLGSARQLPIVRGETRMRFGFTAMALPAPAGAGSLGTVAPDSNAFAVGKLAHRVTMQKERFPLSELPSPVFESAQIAATPKVQGASLYVYTSEPTYTVGAVAFRRKSCVLSSPFPHQTWNCLTSEAPALEKAPSFLFLEGTGGKELAGIESRPTYYDMMLGDTYPIPAPVEPALPPATLIYSHHFPAPGDLRDLLSALALGTPNAQLIETLKKTGTCPTPCVLANARIEDFSVKGMKLVGADLRNAQIGTGGLEGTDFSGADMRFSQLSSRYMDGANFSGARLTNHSFVQVVLNGAKFQGAILSGTQFAQNSMKGVNFRGALLTGARFEQNDIVDSDWSGADATRAKFGQTQLARSNFQSANLTGSDFNQSCLLDALLQKANMTGSLFNQTCIGGVVSTGAISPMNIVGFNRQECVAVCR